MRLRRCSVFFVALAAFPIATAAADPAPIVYAAARADAQTETLAALDLAGGGSASYGYGRTARPDAPVIDLRRAAPASAAARTPPPAAEPPARPDWLEQERVGPPYEANGRWYVPTAEPSYEQTGTASWYGADFHGRPTASGEIFDGSALSAAHPTLPLPSLVQVTNLENGREIIVRVNDRGPFVGERLIDLSRGAAQVLGFEAAGHAQVHVRYLGPAPRRVGEATAAAAPPEGPLMLTPAAPATAVSASPSLVTSAGPGGYFIQVGAFSDPTNAQRVQASLEGAGPVVVDVRRAASGAELFRVRLGPWTNLAEAETARNTAAALGFPDAVVATP